MAEGFGADTTEELAGADDEQTADTEGAMTDETVDPGTTEDRFTDEVPPDPNDPQYKYWQAAYTKTRQRDREQYGKVEAERQQFGEVLRNFYQSDEYALQVLRQRFPQLAHRLTLDGTPQGQQPQGTRQAVNPGQQSSLVDALQQELGEDLAFLAPKLGPVLQRAIEGAIGQAVRPIQEQTAAQQAAARRQQEEQLLAQLDSEHPGWEGRFGADMKTLDEFLNSDDLTHPKFGSKYQLYLKMLNPDLARIDAARAMGQAGRSRLTTGRSGRQSLPNVEETTRKAKTDSEAFRLAAEAAMQELGLHR